MFARLVDELIIMGCGVLLCYEVLEVMLPVIGSVVFLQFVMELWTWPPAVLLLASQWPRSGELEHSSACAVSSLLQQ